MVTDEETLKESENPASITERLRRSHFNPKPAVWFYDTFSSFVYTPRGPSRIRGSEFSQKDTALNSAKPGQTKNEDNVPRNKGIKRKLSSIESMADEKSHTVLKLKNNQDFLLPRNLPIKLAWKKRV